METEQPTRKRRVLRRYSAEDRERLVREHAASGLTKKAFCAQQDINLGTFHGWGKLTQAAAAVFAQVDVPTSAPTAVEVLLPNGVRVGIRHEGRREDLVELLRGVAGVQ